MGRLFGTNGIRGIVNENMNPELALDLGMALGSHFGKGSNLVIGRDSRESGVMLQNAVVSGLMNTGCNVVDIGIAPTPVVQYAVKEYGFKGGVVVTASHNPPEFNGLKCVKKDGVELSREEEDAVEALIFSKNFKTVPWNRTGTVRQADAPKKEYIASMVSQVNAGNIRSKDFSIILDCSNGTAGGFTPSLLSDLHVDHITLNAQPDGTFPGHKSEPVKEHLGDLISLVKEMDVRFGSAQDGDADRAVFIDEKGEFVSGEAALALFSRDAVVKNGGGKVVLTVSASSVVRDSITDAGGEIVQTKVGSPIIAHKMLETGAVFGGEDNGGSIFPGHLHTRDGAMAIAGMLDILARNDKPLSELVAGLPGYVTLRDKLECPNERKAELLEKFAEAFRSEGEIITLDGVKIVTDKGWALARPSGTEPLFRIMVEAKDESTAGVMMDKYMKFFRDLLE